jgi:pimeloyl-ACP methyl ester carboxylesterase
VLSKIWPTEAERLAAWMFCHPLRAKLLPEQEEVLDSGHRFTIKAFGYDLPAWSWGDGPTVLLHHGWNGRASHMTPFVRPLLEAGFSVVTYDAPAHGESAGSVTSAPQMARVMFEVSHRLGGLHGVVAHSIGGPATLLAVRAGLQLEKVVLLASPSNLSHFIDDFGDQLGLDDRIRAGMARRSAKLFRIDWSEMDVAHWAERSRPPLLVFHDRNDRVVAWEHGRRLCDIWEEARLVSTTGLGHSRIRTDPEVLEAAVREMSSC